MPSKNIYQITNTKHINLCSITFLSNIFVNDKGLYVYMYMLFLPDQQDWFFGSEKLFFVLAFWEILGFK